MSIVFEQYSVVEAIKRYNQAHATNLPTHSTFGLPCFDRAFWIRSSETRTRTRSASLPRRAHTLSWADLCAEYDPAPRVFTENDHKQINAWGDLMAEPPEALLNRLARLSIISTYLNVQQQQLNRAQGWWYTLKQWLSGASTLPTPLRHEYQTYLDRQRMIVLEQRTACMNSLLMMLRCMGQSPLLKCVDLKKHLCPERTLSRQSATAEVPSTDYELTAQRFVRVCNALHTQGNTRQRVQLAQLLPEFTPYYPVQSTHPEGVRCYYRYLLAQAQQQYEQVMHSSKSPDSADDMRMNRLFDSVKTMIDEAGQCPDIRVHPDHHEAMVLESEEWSWTWDVHRLAWEERMHTATQQALTASKPLNAVSRVSTALLDEGEPDAPQQQTLRRFLNNEWPEVWALDAAVALYYPAPKHTDDASMHTGHRLLKRAVVHAYTLMGEYLAWPSESATITLKTLDSTLPPLLCARALIQGAGNQNQKKALTDAVHRCVITYLNQISTLTGHDKQRRQRLTVLASWVATVVAHLGTVSQANVLERLHAAVRLGDYTTAQKHALAWIEAHASETVFTPLKNKQAPERRSSHGAVHPAPESYASPFFEPVRIKNATGEALDALQPLRRTKKLVVL